MTNIKYQMSVESIYKTNDGMQKTKHKHTIKEDKQTTNYHKNKLSW
jgi:hypothetical protein